MDSICCPDSASDRWLLNRELAPHIDLRHELAWRAGDEAYAVIKASDVLVGKD